MSPEPTVVGRGSPSRSRGTTTEIDAWRWIGWLGLALATVGLGDLLLTWIPLELGSPEWEFGTIASSFSGLPLVTMGLAGLLGSALARGVRWQVAGLGILLLALALALIAALVLFLLVIPVALGAVQGEARVGILKAVVRTTLLGVVFSLAYLAAGIGALRSGRKA
jgi:MFS family permease